MTYDHELILINNKSTSKDEIGQQIKSEIYTNILCAVKSIGRNEYYAAAKAGLKPVKSLTVHSYEYNGELKVRLEGKEYKVIRTYATGIEETELICEGAGVNG